MWDISHSISTTTLTAKDVAAMPVKTSSSTTKTSSSSPFRVQSFAAFPLPRLRLDRRHPSVSFEDLERTLKLDLIMGRKHAFRRRLKKALISFAALALVKEWARPERSQ